MSERFYLNLPLQLGLVILTGPEAHHLATVCRLRADNPVCLFNGDGRDYHGRVAAVSKRSVEVLVTEAVDISRELPFQLEVAAPLPKGDRAQFLIEKLTELGVTTFVPLSSRRSVVEPRAGKLEKLQRYVIEASKQCGRNVLLEVRPLQTWDEFCASAPPAARLLAHPAAESSIQLAPLAQFLPAPCSTVVVAVGPEGGFTEEEVALAQASGWQRIHLGPRILRVETAALLLAALVISARSWAVPSSDAGTC